MQLLTAKQPGSRLELTFQLDAQDVKTTFGKVLGELATRGQIPGFRPGKAPASIIRRRYKPEMLDEMFWMQVVEDYVEKELASDDLGAMSDPEFPDFKEIEVAEDAPLEFTISITVRPEVELPDYAGLKVYRVPAEVTDEQVETVLNDMLKAAARQEKVTDRPVQHGDKVRAEIVVQLEGSDEPGETATEDLEIGSGRYDPAIDEAMVGHVIGDTVEVPVDYPEDQSDPNLAGKKGVIRAIIGEISAEVLPELTDEFAQARGEYEGVEDLREKTRAQLLEAAEQRSVQAVENDTLGAVVRDAVLDMPTQAVEQLANRSFHSFMHELEEAGLTLDQFKGIANVTDETLEMNERIRAEASLRVSFVMEALAKAEGIEVDDEVLADEVKVFAAENQVDEEVVTRALELQDEVREQLTGRARRRLTIAALLAKTEIEDVSQERYDEIKEEDRQTRAEAARVAAEAAAAEAAAAEAEAEAADSEAEAGDEAEPNSEATVSVETEETSAPAADEEPAAPSE